VNLDEDALIAAVDLVGRTGAEGFKVGYLDDEPGTDWYAEAQFRGAKVIVEAPGPVEAAEALARRLMEGGKCVRCGCLIALSDSGAVAHPGRMLDGTTWTAEQAAAAGQCRWTRMGRKWVSACGAGQDPPPGERSQPRRQSKAQRRRGRSLRTLPRVIPPGNHPGRSPWT
jgi:hypothetical protein